jgi:hypothetical protein
MKAIEFLAELQQIQDAFTWEYRDEHEIRGFLKTVKGGMAFDPLAAVAFVKSGREFIARSREASSGLLGLSGSDAAAIGDAADNALWKYVDGRLVLDGYSAWLRDELALATGLEMPDVQEFPDGRLPVEALSVGGEQRERA